MGAVFGNGSIYSVHVYEDKENHYNRTFEGDRAFSEANDVFENMKSDPTARELWLVRWDGSEWKFVTKPIKRNAMGEWEANP